MIALSVGLHWNVNANKDIAQVATIQRAQVVILIWAQVAIPLLDEVAGGVAYQITPLTLQWEVSVYTVGLRFYWFKFDQTST